MNRFSDVFKTTLEEGNANIDNYIYQSPDNILKKLVVGAAQAFRLPLTALARATVAQASQSADPLDSILYFRSHLAMELAKPKQDLDAIKGYQECLLARGVTEPQPFTRDEVQKLRRRGLEIKPGMAG